MEGGTDEFFSRATFHIPVHISLDRILCIPLDVDIYIMVILRNRVPCTFCSLVNSCRLFCYQYLYLVKNPGKNKLFSLLP